MKYRTLVVLKKRILKDGTSPICIEYRFDRTHRLLIRTGKRVAETDWNMVKGEVRKSHPDHVKINLIIQNMKRKMDEIISDAMLQNEVPTIRYIKEKMERPETEGRMKALDVEPCLQQWFHDSQHRVTPGLHKQFKVLRTHLRGYMKWKGCKLMVTDLADVKFMEDFKLYLENEIVIKGEKVGLMKSTVSSKIKHLKFFLTFCTKQGILPKVDLTEFKYGSESGEHVFLSEAELTFLENLDLSGSSALKRTRDLFLIGCETGLRYSDLSTLRPEHINGDRIRKPMRKTGKNVVIPVSPRLRRLLDEYNNKLPYAPHSVVFNRQIKDVCLLAGIDSPFSRLIRRGNRKQEVTIPKYMAVASHTCRRTFCTNQFLRGMPTFLIRKISGHSSERAFLQYIRIDEEQAADEMVKRWLERERD